MKGEVRTRRSTDAAIRRLIDRSQKTDHAVLVRDGTAVPTLDAIEAARDMEVPADGVTSDRPVHSPV